MIKFNNRLDIPGMTYPRELNVLSNVANLVPDNGSILEIGPCFGRTTHALYIGKKPTVKLTTLDVWNRVLIFPEGSYEGNKELLDELLSISHTEGPRKGFEHCLGKEIIDNIEVIQQSSSTFQPQKTYDLVFIDGDHDFEAVSKDIGMFAHNHQTLIIGDDANLNSWGVVRAIWEQRGCRTIVVPSAREIKMFALIPPEGYWKTKESEIVEILGHNFK